MITWIELRIEDHPIVSQTSNLILIFFWASLMVLSAIRTRIFRSSKDHLEIYQHYLSSTWRVASWKKPCSSGISVRYTKSNDMSLGKIGSWLTTMAGIIIYKKETEDGDTDWTVNLLLNLYLLYYVHPWSNSNTLQIGNSKDKQHLNLHFVAF